MSVFAIASMGLGAAVAAFSVPCAVAPRFAAAMIKAFPRSAAAGIILAVIDLIWSAWLLLITPLGGFEHLKPAVYYVTPVAIVAVTLFLRELLAPRALGGFFLLAGAPLLDLARWNESPMRLVVVVLIYALVVAGITLILNPSRFRKTMAGCVENERVCRAVGITGLVIGLAIVGLAVAVY